MAVILWFIVFYLLFRFIFKFVIPLISATRTMRSQVNELRQNMEGQQSSSKSESFSNSGDTGYSKSASKPAESKGDYIDFEEIK